MFRALLLCGALAAPAAVAPTVPSLSANPKVLKAIDAWLKAYRGGRIDVSSDKSIAGESIAKKYGALPKGMLGRLTARREIEVLLEQAVEMKSVDACQRALAVAAVGLDKRRYTMAMAPHIVRQLGEKALGKFKSNDAKDFLLEVAKGNKKVGIGSSGKVGSRAAALRSLGAFGEASFRPTIESQLGAKDAKVRLAAAEAVQVLGTAASAEPLADALSREVDDLCVQAMVNALDLLITKHEKTIAVPVKQIAVRAAIQALGRASWRADMACVDFLARFRSSVAVPALINVLQQFVDRPKDIVKGKLSGLLRHRAHDALVSLTGAFYPMNKPDQWRAWWKTVEAGFKVAATPKKPAKSDKPGTVSNFFGIPVEGTRVVFVVDISGSMAFPMSDSTTTAPPGAKLEKNTRLEFAQAHLTYTIGELASETSFNIVTFEALVRSWQDKLVLANKGNKRKAIDYVNSRRANGGTNTWGALENALAIKSLVYGDRYTSNIDEVFFLSDGFPSVGSTTDAREILRLVRETNHFAKVRINTVYIASELTDRDKEYAQRNGMDGVELMKKLAEQNGGKFVKL